MGFAAGLVSFRRFFINGKLPAHADDSFVDAIRANAFGHASDASPDGVQIGWISPTNLFDTDVTEEKIAVDHFVHLWMRLDRTAPPGNIVRSYVALEEEAERQASGRQLLTNKQRKEARQKGTDRAEKEARDGRFRRVSAVPVLIDLRAKTVYFGNLGNTAADKFIQLFRDTFDMPIELGGSDDLAYRITSAAGDSRAVEDAEPFHLVTPTAVVDDDGFSFDDRQFFGKEFLTWLWYKSEADEGTFTLRGENVFVTFSGTMRLDCDFKSTGTDTIRCDAPARSPEAKAALEIGKQPVKAGIILGGRGGEFPLVFDGPRFNVSSLRLPDSEAVDRRAKLEERFTQITEVAGLLDSLFGLYLGQRASADWTTELDQMKAWATGKPATTLNLRFQAESAVS